MKMDVKYQRKTKQNKTKQVLVGVHSATINTTSPDKNYEISTLRNCSPYFFYFFKQ